MPLRAVHTQLPYPMGWGVIDRVIERSSETPPLVGMQGPCTPIETRVALGGGGRDSRLSPRGPGCVQAAVWRLSVCVVWAGR